MNKPFGFIRWNITIAFAVFVILSPFLMVVTRSFLSFMLGFNVFLAFVPMFLIWYLTTHPTKTFFHYLLVVVFILFLPNTFYVITDMIHLNSASFYTSEALYSPNVYLEDIGSYIMLVHIGFTVLFGVYAGIVSLIGFETLLRSYRLKAVHINLILFATILLSSIGIYIGRFLRFFSWDILNPLKILTELIQNMNLFMVLFILLFTGVQGILYYMGKHIIPTN